MGAAPWVASDLICFRRRPRLSVYMFHRRMTPSAKPMAAVLRHAKTAHVGLFLRCDAATDTTLSISKS